MAKFEVVIKKEDGFFEIESSHDTVLKAQEHIENNKEKILPILFSIVDNKNANLAISEKEYQLIEKAREISNINNLC